MIKITSQEEFEKYRSKEKEMFYFPQSVVMDILVDDDTGYSIKIDGTLTARYPICIGGNLDVDGYILSSGFIRVGGYIKTLEYINVTDGIESGNWIQANGYIKSGDFIDSGNNIQAVHLIEARDFIKSGGDIKADEVKAGSHIESFGKITGSKMAGYYTKESGKVETGYLSI